MSYYSFLEDEQLVTHKLRAYLKKLFTERTLVVYDVRSSIIPEVLPHIPHVATYDQRILSLLSDCTFVCSEPFDQKILEHYQTLWLSQNITLLTLPHQSDLPLVEQLLADDELITSLHGRFETLVVFFPTPAAEILAQRLGSRLINTLEISLAANNKTDLKKYILDQQLPAIHGVITRDPHVIREHFGHEDEYFFKLPHGVSGYGFFTNASHSLEEILEATKDLEIIIEKKITIQSSPSVQFFIDGDEIVIFGTTDQVLIDDRFYNGNTSPSMLVGSPYEGAIFSQAQSVLEYLQGLGYQGFGGIDFMISAEGDVYVAEINARFTGATPASVVSILLHNSVHKPRKFVMEEESEYVLDHSSLDISANNQYDEIDHLPICIGGLAQWKQVQTVYFL